MARLSTLPPRELTRKSRRATGGSNFWFSATFELTCARVVACDPLGRGYCLHILESCFSRRTVFGALTRVAARLSSPKSSDAAKLESDPRSGYSTLRLGMGGWALCPVLICRTRR
jgi:hypothetical protein